MISSIIDEEESEDSVDICALIENNKISQFVNEKKAEFQDIVAVDSLIYFNQNTGPNHGEVIYYLNGNLTYIFYDYG